MKVAICTLGCKVNQYETQALEQELLHRGHTLVDFEETADAYVVNTCSVTAVSAAMNGFNRELLAAHIHSCVVRDIRDGKDEVVDELIATIQKLMK